MANYNNKKVFSIKKFIKEEFNGDKEKFEQVYNGNGRTWPYELEGKTRLEISYTVYGVSDRWMEYPKQKGIII